MNLTSSLQHTLVYALDISNRRKRELAGRNFGNIIRKERGGNTPGNSITLVSEARTLSDIMAVILESNRDGAIVTTRIPCRARSRVRGRVSERIAPLEAA
jgi:hypothetical protein